jgi:anaphase-promoting complex subunit 4
MTGLENLRSLVHENMLPALERSTIILSRLLGLARFHGTKDDIGFTAAQITKLLDIISCLTLVTHKILLLVMEELDLFSTFSMWLRFEIDRLASSSGGEELSEKEAMMDIAKVLAYIQRYLTTSPLAVYFDEVDKDDYTRDWKHAEDGVSLLDMLEKQLKRRGSGQPFMKAMPNLDFLINYLSSRAKAVLNSIAETQRRSVRFAQPIRLEIGTNISKYALRLCAKPSPVRSSSHPTQVSI